MLVGKFEVWVPQLFYQLNALKIKKNVTLSTFLSVLLNGAMGGFWTEKVMGSLEFDIDFMKQVKVYCLALNLML